MRPTVEGQVKTLLTSPSVQDIRNKRKAIIRMNNEWLAEIDEVWYNKQSKAVDGRGGKDSESERYALGMEWVKNDLLTNERKDFLVTM